MLALPQSRTRLTLPEKFSERVEVGDALPTRLIEKPDQNTRCGEGIAVGPVAIRDLDPVVARNRVQISDGVPLTVEGGGSGESPC